MRLSVFLCRPHHSWTICPLAFQTIKLHIGEVKLRSCVNLQQHCSTSWSSREWYLLLPGGGWMDSLLVAYNWTSMSVNIHPWQENACSLWNSEHASNYRPDWQWLYQFASSYNVTLLNYEQAQYMRPYMADVCKFYCTLAISFCY
jgi:hypothetical protein